MAFGFSPRYIGNIEITEISHDHAFVSALEAAEKLGWNIGFISESGFIAYTKFSMSSWSEEVQVHLQEDKINLESECTGSQLMDWGKNKKNVESFINTFDKVKEKLTQDEAIIKYAELERKFVPKENDLINRPPLAAKEKMANFFSVFKPTEGYFVTPVLLVINLLVFVFMAISGVDIMSPDGESLVFWGANFRPVTLDGGWWRLLSSCFVHIGILHLLMNMYALVYIGLLLEPYLGKSRFLGAYLLTGIAGSAASVYWHELTVSAGASGAIFGMYGVFLAMLTTNFIEKSARRALLTSIAVFVGYNLLNGLKGGIDNAAHIGGLLSGLIIGYAFYPGLIKPNLPQLKAISIGSMAVLILSGSMLTVSQLSSDISQYEKEMQSFVSMEEMALEVYNLPENTPNEEILSAIKDRGIYYWTENIRLLEKLETLDLPAEIHDRNARLKEYCQLRIQCYQIIYKAISEDTDKYNGKIEFYNTEIENLIEELTGKGN